jgi:dephospho-CoA kinase
MRIAFTGKAGSGKTTAADLLVSRGYQKLSFAAPMKRDVLEMVRKHAPWVTLETLDQGKDLFRTVLQGYGTECIKPLCGDDYWANLTVRESEHFALCSVDDMRFTIEATRWREAGGIVVKVNCPDSIRKIRLERKFGRDISDAEWEKWNSHQSEKEVDLIDPDFEIDNSRDSVVFLASALKELLG